MDAIEIIIKTRDGDRLNLKGEPRLLRSLLGLVGDGLDVRVVAEDHAAAPQVVVSTRDGFLCDRCESVWKNRAGLNIHRSKTHGLRREKPTPRVALPAGGR